MAAMKTRTLEVTIISGENLCIEQSPVRENVYVAVRAESLRCWTTKTAKQEAESLSIVWNEKLMVEVPLHAQSITFEVQCKRARGMVGSIGVARIAIGDVIPKEEKGLEMVSYRLRNWEGRRSGVINFCVRVVKKEQETTAAEKEKGEGPIMGNNSGDFKPDITANGYAMGIPCCWNWNHAGYIRV